MRQMLEGSRKSLEGYLLERAVRDSLTRLSMLPHLGFSIEPKPAPIVPKSPITMTELLLQIAAMQTDFDLRMQVMAKRLAVLEAK